MSQHTTGRSRPAISGASSEADDARAGNIAAGRALSETIRTTLGPKGLDKMLVTSDGTVVVTNDGASILDRMDIDHPAARAIVETAEQQDRRAADGTTTAVMLAGELLAEAESLLERGLHPTNVVEGYAWAGSRAVESLAESALDVDPDDETRLREIARTVITGKWDEEATEFLAGLAVDTVRSTGASDRVDLETITRKTISGGSFYDSERIDGLLIDMESSSTDVVSPGALPRRIEGATVALVDDQLTIETATGTGTVTVDSPEQLAAFREYEDEIYEAYVGDIAATGADVVFCQKGIDDPVRAMLAREGILAVERTRQDELYKLARATGARYVASTDELTPAHAGEAAVVDRRPVGDREVTVVRADEDAEQVSLLLRGGTEHVAEETKRLLDDCIYVLKFAVERGRVVPGGGATETSLAGTLRTEAAALEGREQLAAEAFADALEVVPRTLAETAGLDPIDAVVELRARHHGGEATAGVAVTDGRIDDVLPRGVLEPLVVKERAITGAMEAATTLLRIDEVIPTSADEEETDDHDHGSGPGGLVESTEGYPWAVGHSMGHDHGHSH